MKLKIVTIASLMVFIFCGTYTLFAQQLQPAPNLKPLGVIAPDGRKMIFPMRSATAQKFEREMGVVLQEAGVNFVRAKSWKVVAHAAKASADDLERTIADLVARVDALEKRVDALEEKVK